MRLLRAAAPLLQLRKPPAAPATARGLRGSAPAASEDEKGAQGLGERVAERAEGVGARGGGAHTGCALMVL